MLLGDYPVTQALKRGELKSSVDLEFADVKTPSTAFKRVVRNLEFDCAELAIVTFLMAKAHGKPLVLLPAVVLARFQHPHIVYNIERGPLAPDAVREIYRLLAESKKAAKLPKPGEFDTHPFGLEANRRSLEVVIDTVYQQRMIPRRFAVEELFDDVTRKLG